MPNSTIGSEETRKQAHILKALADPARLQILAILKREAGMVRVSKIVEEFDLAQPTIAHHLHVLLEAGLVNYKRSGFQTFYFIEAAAMKRVCAMIHDLIPEKKEQPKHATH